MASWTPVAIQKENAPVRLGKHSDRLKTNVPRPAKRGLQERRALQDLSNTGTPAPSKVSTLKDKSAIPARQITKSVQKSPFLNDEELRRCNEWAKDGIEHAHFTGNDMQKLQKDAEDKRVKKKVQKVVSAVSRWSKTAYDEFLLPTEEAPEDFLDAPYIGLQEEVFPLSRSGNKEIDDILFEPEFGDLPILDCPVVLALKDED